jgi:hypothetical protein
MKESLLSRISNPEGKSLGCMRAHSKLFLFVFACLCGTLIGSIYAFVLPSPYPEFRTCWILGLGTLGTAQLCGFVGYHSREANSTGTNVVTGICYAVVGAFVVIYVSFLIILNTHGS